MTLDQAVVRASIISGDDWIATEHRIAYGPITCELHDSNGWLLGSGDTWELAFERAYKKGPFSLPSKYQE